MHRWTARLVMYVGLSASAAAAPVILRMTAPGAPPERVSVEMSSIKVLGFSADETKACVLLEGLNRTGWSVREVWMRPVATAPAAPRREAGTVAGPGNGFGGAGTSPPTLTKCE